MKLGGSVHVPTEHFLATLLFIVDGKPVASQSPGRIAEDNRSKNSRKILIVYKRRLVATRIERGSPRRGKKRDKTTYGWQGKR